MWKMCKLTSVSVTNVKSHIVSTHKNTNKSAEHFSYTREPMCETCFIESCRILMAQFLNAWEVEVPTVHKGKF